MHEALAARGIGEVAGVLLDIGTSSPQLDDAARGFSFSRDGPLDMRMDNSRGATAADFVNRAEESELREVISEYGEERFAKQVAAAIVAARRLEPIRTTRQLAEIVGRAVRTREPGQHPATRTFQALRIHVNQELEELEVTLPQAASLLAPAGRLAVVSFHSLEDRIVKWRLRGWAEQGKATVLTRKPIVPDAEEMRANPRARSAKLRVAERT
jgi:16S rRNA (cytosine1402-N4)-methyltransferase